MLIFLQDIAKCLIENSQDGLIRLVIKAEPNSLNPYNTSWDALYDPKCKKLVTISKAFSRADIRLAAYPELIFNSVMDCFNQLRHNAYLLYVAVEWEQYVEQPDGELKYEHLEEVFLKYKKERT